MLNGFQNINSIRKSNFDYLSSKYDAEKIANEISVNIVTAYLQLLYNSDLVEVNEQKVSISELQVERISKMVEVGTLRTLKRLCKSLTIIIFASLIGAG